MIPAPSPAEAGPYVDPSQCVLPKLFKEDELRDLDSAEDVEEMLDHDRARSRAEEARVAARGARQSEP